MSWCSEYPTTVLLMIAHRREMLGALVYQWQLCLGDPQRLSNTLRLGAIYPY